MPNEVKIKNKAELLRVPEPYKHRRKILLDILEGVFTKIDAEKLTHEALREEKFGKYKNVYLMGAGKASYAMAQALKNKITKGIIVVPHGSKLNKLPGIEILFASHPIPCCEGRKSAQKLLNFAKKAGKDDLVIFLLSGGASAMLPLPIQGVSLKDKIRITKLLLKKSATINEINTVRKHLSQIKGGQLAKALYPAKTICLAFSDVVKDDPSVIGSGPLSPDATTKNSAQKILKKYKIPCGAKFKETPDKKDQCFKNIDYRIIANHKTVLLAAQKIAKKFKLKTYAHSHSLTGEARKIGPKLVKINKKGLLIATGETTVNVKGKGRGGRNQELVLAAIPHLKQNQTILSVGTDGIDGITPKKVAGAIADRVIETKNAEKFLSNNDSYHYFLDKKSLIETGPTQQNLGDLIMILKD